jgi:hypothetical protein
MKTIRIATAAVLIVAGAACAWFWWTAFNQQSDLVGAGIQTPADLKEQLPVFSAALDMLNVDIFAPSDDPMGTIMRLNGQLWRRTLLGVVVFFIGIGLLLFGRTEPRGKSIALITGRVVIAVLLCCSCFLIWWSWHNRNARLPVVEMNGGPNNEIHRTQ